MQPVTRRSVRFVDPETGVYYILPDEEDEEEVQTIYQIQPGYGKGRGQPPRLMIAPPRAYTRIRGSSTPVG